MKIRFIKESSHSCFAMCLAAVFSIISLSVISSAANAKNASEIPADDRIKILTYNSNDVYRIPTKYGYQTSIVFSASEMIKTVSVGDRSMWQIVPSGNRIFLRPMDDNLATNMTVITNVREYNFDIESVATGKAGNLYVIQFRYPDKSLHGKKSPEFTPEFTETQEPVQDMIPIPTHKANNPESNNISKPLAADISTEKNQPAPNSINIPTLDTQRVKGMNRNYSYIGSDELAPAEVYDDGKDTYVIFQKIPSSMPKPLLSGNSGDYSVATHSVNGNKLIIRTVVRRFTLSSDAGEITVYNDQFN